MTAVLPDRVEATEASDDDLRTAVRHALDRAGCSFDELAAQAKTGDFVNVRAQMAWVVVADLGDLAH